MKPANFQPHGAAVEPFDIDGFIVGPGGGEFPSRPDAPTTESIQAAMKAGRWRGTEMTRGALETLFKFEHMEQFNFGPLKLNTIREAQKEAMEFLEYGCWSLPYPECIMRCSVEFDNRTVGFHLFCVQKDVQDTKAPVATIGTIHSDKYVLSFRTDNKLNMHMHPEGRALEINVPGGEIRYWEPMIGAIDARRLAEDGNAAIITEGTLITLGLVMILNTKGVLKERAAPPAKPNKVRASRGIPLLPYTTKVYTAVYNRAVREGPAGTHASPRPHRRRAHVRHYPKTDKHEAYIRKVDAMLVNWDGKPLAPRAEYEVKNV